MKYKLLLLQAEETLIQSDGSIAPEDIEALLDIQKKGIRLAVITFSSETVSQNLLAPLQLIRNEGFVLRCSEHKSEIEGLTKDNIIRNDYCATKDAMQVGQKLVKDIKQLLFSLMVKRSELVAVGSSYTSIPMIEYAGLGVAMADAPEQIKACSDYVTVNKEKHGVAHLIEKFILRDEITKKNIDDFNHEMENSMVSNLGIKIISINSNRIEGSMPVDKRTCQPYGVVAGGASLAFAETIAGIGSRYLIRGGEIAVGMQISGNHVSAALVGETLTGIATIIHQGRSSHVWNVDVTTATGKLVSTARVVNSILKKR
ncbi:MAG: hotdog fold thioesterase [Bacteroidaceae bacterium]